MSLFHSPRTCGVWESSHTCCKNTLKSQTHDSLLARSDLHVVFFTRLSGLSPFLGDDDNETLNNILACQWNFEEEEFVDISDEAKDFITRLLVKSKSWRMSATESLKHPWLSDQSLHYRLNQKVEISFKFCVVLTCFLKMGWYVFNVSLNLFAAEKQVPLHTRSIYKDLKK